MSTAHHAAIWMDHNEARFLALGADGHTEMAHVHAHDLHTHPKKYAGHRHPPDDRFIADLKTIIARCEAVVLFGPSQARLDLVADLEAEHSPLCARIIAVLPLDRVSDAQLVARAREVFHEYERMRGIHVAARRAHA